MGNLVVDETRYYNEYAPLHATHGDLPHWSQEHKVAFVTFRLADSLPADVLERLSSEYEQIMAMKREHPDDMATDERLREWHNRWERQLDSGHGSCALQNPEVRRIVAKTLKHFNGSRYTLHSFVIMPNHIHLIMETLGGYRLQDIIRSIKLYSARHVNAHLGRQGRLWQKEYYDRLIRSREHYDRTRRYIYRNPQYLAPGTFTYWEAEPINWLCGVP